MYLNLRCAQILKDHKEENAGFDICKGIKKRQSCSTGRRMRRRRSRGSCCSCSSIGGVSPAWCEKMTNFVREIGPQCIDPQQRTVLHQRDYGVIYSHKELFVQIPEEEADRTKHVEVKFTKETGKDYYYINTPTNQQSKKKLKGAVKYCSIFLFIIIYAVP